MAIVFYKAFTATLLAATSVSIFLALKNYDRIQDVAEAFTLAGKRGIIAWILEKGVNLSPKTLLFSAVGTGVYAFVAAIEAVGLWYEKAWARWLVIGVVGISIPPEFFELTRGISPIKAIILFLNLVIFWYLLREFPKSNSPE